MQYTLVHNDIELTEDTRAVIDAKLSLNLSRFTNAIAQCEIAFVTESVMPEKLVRCTVKIRTNAGEQIEISDTAKDPVASFTHSLTRTKRSVERHLKHKNQNINSVGMQQGR